MQKIKCTLILLTLLMGTRCSDDDRAARSADTQLLTISSGWIMTAFTSDPAFDYDGDGSASVDLYLQEHPCFKDDTLKFYNDGSAGYVSGNIDCGYPLDLTGFVWSLSVDHTTIIWGTGSGSTELHLESLTEDRLIYSYSTLQNVDGVILPYTWTRTFERADVVK